MPQTPFVAPEPASSSRAYRPLSGLAVAGFILAAGYAILVAVFVAVAYSTGTPLPGLWTLLFPITAAVLALVGRRRVRRSDGALGGASLAACGLGLAALSGLAYLVYAVSNHVMVASQAQTFTEAWISKIGQGQTFSAFLDTREPADAASLAGSDPSAPDADDDLSLNRVRYRFLGVEGDKGPLPAFEDNRVTRMIRDAGSPVRVEQVRVERSDYLHGEYVVRSVYRVSTPQATFELAVTVRARPGKAYRGRRWRVDLYQTTFVGNPSLTPLGTAVARQLESGTKFLENWLDRYNGGDLVGAYLDTVEADRRTRLARQVWLGGPALAAAAAVSPAPPGPGVGPALTRLDRALGSQAAQCRLLPGYPQFAAAGLVQASGFHAVQDYRRQVPARIKELFADPARLAIARDAQYQPFAKRLSDDRLEVVLDVTLVTYPPAGKAALGEYRAFGRLVAQSDVGPGAAGREPAWRVVRIELNQGGIVWDPKEPKFDGD